MHKILGLPDNLCQFSVGGKKTGLNNKMTENKWNSYIL